MRNLTRLWRRSIQTRVVASTILLSTLVIGATGWALLSDVADGLADSRRRTAIAEARSGFQVAQDQLDAALESEPETQALGSHPDGRLAHGRPRRSARL